MTTQTLLLSSNINSNLITLPTTFVYDINTIVFGTSAIYADKPLLSIKIDWGDRSEQESYQNDFFNDEGGASETSFGYEYTILNNYTHVYSPSNKSLTSKLSAQLVARYYDGTMCRFVIPLTIISPSVVNKLGDLDILSVNSLNTSNDYLLSIHTSKEGYVVDTVLSV